jgi:predicted N-acetyltransferase YhbS
MGVHAGDILMHQPGFVWDGAQAGSVAFLVQRDDETVGVVLVHDVGDSVAHVVLDYVTPRFRDFSPGEFVWRRSTALRDRGFRTVITPEHMVAPYYARLGFRPLDNGSFELVL